MVTFLVTFLGFSLVIIFYSLYKSKRARDSHASEEIKEDNNGVESGKGKVKEVVGKRDLPYNSYLKIYASVVPNTKISLQQKVAVSEFEKFLKDGSKINMVQEMKHVYMWDFGVTASKHLKKGDIIWILTGDKLYETKLSFIIQDKEGLIGDEIGWSRQFGSPWKNVSIFSSCIKHERIPEWVNSYSRGEKNSLAKNFYKVS